MAEDRICVGAIAGAFGVRGEVRLKSFCAQPGDIAGYGPLTSEDGKRSFAVTLTRPVTGGLGARLRAARHRRGAEVEDDHLVIGVLHDVPAHGPAHVADADEPDLHDTPPNRASADTSFVRAGRSIA